MYERAMRIMITNQHREKSNKKNLHISLKCIQITHCIIVLGL